MRLHIASMLALITIADFSALAQINRITDVIKSLTLSDVETVDIVNPGKMGTAKIKAGCSAHYIVIQVTLGENFTFGSQSSIVLIVDGQTRVVPLLGPATGDFRKARSLVFSEGSAKQGFEQIDSIGTDQTDRRGPIRVDNAQIQKNVDVFANSLMMIDMARISAGSLAEAYRAKSIVMILPMSEGGQPEIEIRPQEGNFKAFANQCAPPGVTDVPGNPARSTQPIPKTPYQPSAPDHSINDTYAQLSKTVDLNQASGTRDDVGSTGWLPRLNVCYSITHDPADPPHVIRKCEQTGETVRVPGDLIVPTGFWERSSPDYFANRCKKGNKLEVKVKGAANDGKKRFITCTDAFVLSGTRTVLLDEGVHK